ncbi:MAG: type II toxin-antitoxin system HigB family toxin [Bdellovibrionaceae bacterium]|jgi:mRNA interferase HigB|nr:type II toxin-antitoxin system HigB family toxin [Pseudobdellovibrionaceae bacterium]
MKWLKLMESNNFLNFHDLKKRGYNSVDYLGEDLFCFDIGGNNYRLLARIHFGQAIIFIEKLLTHKEYERR